MGEHPLRDVGQVGAREDARAELGVPANVSPILVVERLLFLENRVGDADLAHVVKHAGERHAVD